MTDEKLKGLEERVTNIEGLLQHGTLGLVRLEDEYADSEALQFSQERVDEIANYADNKNYIYEFAGYGAFIFDSDHAEDVKQFATAQGIKYRLLEIVDPLVNPEEAARIIDRIRAESEN